MGPELVREPAQVAELVDALVSGTSAFTGVEVRVLSWAPCLKSGIEEPQLFASFSLTRDACWLNVRDSWPPSVPSKCIAAPASRLRSAALVYTSACLIVRQPNIAIS